MPKTPALPLRSMPPQQKIRLLRAQRLRMRLRRFGLGAAAVSVFALTAIILGGQAGDCTGPCPPGAGIQAASVGPLA